MEENNQVTELQIIQAKTSGRVCNDTGRTNRETV